MRDDPSDGAALDIGLEVHTLDRNERFGDGRRGGTVGTPGSSQGLGFVGNARLDAPLGWKRRKEIDQSQSIIDIRDGINEARIPLTDQMMQSVRWGVVLHASSFILFVTSGGTADLMSWQSKNRYVECIK